MLLRVKQNLCNPCNFFWGGHYYSEENHNIYYRAQKSKTKHKKKIAAAIYEYQADCDGEWGEISLNFEDSTAEIVRLADWDTVKTNKFAIRAIAYLLNCENEKLPKEMMVAFE